MAKMAKTQKKTLQTKSRISYFLIPCFHGCSEEVSEKNFVKTIGSDGKKNTRSFFLPRFRMKKSSGIKTVPVESTLSEKADSKHKIKVPASRSKPDKLILKPQAPEITNEPPSQIRVPEPVPSDQTPKAKERPQETTYGQGRNIVLERREHLDHLDTSKEDTCQKRLTFRRRKETIRTGSSQPGSPENYPKPNRFAAISPTLSLPMSVSANSRAMPKKPNRHWENESSAGKLDPVVGLSIVMITLMIILVWGRLCAVLCTSAWFYFVPRLSNATKSQETGGKDPNSHNQDFDSEEHKKKVVMEGFLERNNHRSTL